MSYRGGQISKLGIIIHRINQNTCSGMFKISICRSKSERLDGNKQNSERGRQAGGLKQSCLDARCAIKLKTVWTS